MSQIVEGVVERTFRASSADGSRVVLSVVIRQHASCHGRVHAALPCGQGPEAEAAVLRHRSRLRPGVRVQAHGLYLLPMHGDHLDLVLHNCWRIEGGVDLVGVITLPRPQLDFSEAA